MKESTRLRKQQLEKSIQDAERAWSRLEKYFNYFIRGIWIATALFLIYTYSSPVFGLYVFFALIFLGISLLVMFFKTLVVTKPREYGRAEFEILRAELDEEAKMNNQ